MKNEQFKYTPNGKEISAGVIVCNSKGDVLACHPTMQKKGVMYDLPKGHVEVGENDIDAAIREVAEETGLSIDKNKLIDKGVRQYTKHKYLHLFMLFIDKDLSELLPHLKCMSYFEGKNGRKIPEMNGYAILTKEQYNLFMPALYNYLKPILNEI